MTTIAASFATEGRALRFDRLGVLIALIVAAGAALQPFVLFRANRIVQGEGRSILEALPPGECWLLIAVLAAAIAIAVMRTPAMLRLAAALSALAALLVLVGRSATWLTPEGNSFARIAPGAGFWIAAFGVAIMVADALTRRRLQPLERVGILLAIAAALGLLLGTGVLDDLSVMKEYANRAASFWAEMQRHVLLAFGSLAAAVLVGIPLGILCQRVRTVRAAILNVLNIVQTVPSIALFGLLIAPLAWISANLPAAAALGVSGIGPAPALVALFAYSLLPVVANTVVGIEGVAPAAVEAARGMGMTSAQRLFQVELPLAFPVILTGIRIVLVQNIGLATIAALIGGGGLGVFVFLGIGQTAMDLVLLGAIPTVGLAFSAAVLLDAAVEAVSRERRTA